MIPQATIASIIDTLDLPDFIGETVELIKKNGCFEGLCPFHKESTASFKVYHDHYHCFGCGAHGGGIEYLMITQGLTFPESVRYLATRTGVEVPTSTSFRKNPDAFSGARDALRRACAKYQQILLGPQGGSAMNALTERGIDDDTIIRFGIGYAPDEWSTLSGDRTFKVVDLEVSGLSVQSKGNKGCYDLFRNRLTFPIRADNGDVIGFGGRRLGQEGPKYINSPETRLYQKGNALFGLQQASQAIRLTRSIIVCEGFFDVITTSQAQIEHIVSTCGTAMTETQAEIVLSLAERVYFCFDGDGAGAKATRRAAEMLVPLVGDHHEIRLCRLPDDEDPDSFIRKYGADRFRKVLDDAPLLTAYLLDAITCGAKLPESRIRALSVVTSLWRQISAAGLKIFFRQYACEALQIHPDEFDRMAGIAPIRAGENTLRACPCCGSEASLSANNTGFHAQCTRCGVATQATATENECRSIWNRRDRPRPRGTISQKPHLKSKA